MVEPVQLVCIASYHDNTVYTWKGADVSIISCCLCVTSRIEVVNFIKGQVISQMMEVDIEPGVSTIATGTILFWLFQLASLVVTSLRHKD